MAEKTNATAFLRTAGVLTLICTLVAALLSGVYALTNGVYEQNLLRAKQTAIASLFEEQIAVVCETSEQAEIVLKEQISGVEGVEACYAVYAKTEFRSLVGYCASVTASGFGGDISMMVAVSQEGDVLGVEIVSMSETPGLGSRAGEQEHLAQYVGTPNHVILGGGVVLGEDVDAISGATISSKAVNEGVNRALEALWACYFGGDPE